MDHDPATAAILLPGAGSTAEFVRRAFAQLLQGRRSTVVIEPAGDATGLAEQIDSAARTLRRQGCRVQAVAGVSIGAHAAARWAATTGVTDVELLLVMPAWTGSPGPTAAATASAAEQVHELGVQAELDRLSQIAEADWVLAELQRAWPTWDADELVAGLRTASRSRGPRLEELAAIRARTGVVALSDDPFHPAAVAQQWHRLIPRSGLQLLDRQDPAADVAVLGRAAQKAISESR